MFVDLEDRWKEEKLNQWNLIMEYWLKMNMDKNGYENFKKSRQKHHNKS